MTDTAHSLPYETVAFDGVLYPCAVRVPYRNLGRFENRVLIGNPSKDDDDLLSTKVWGDFSGGCGVYDEVEGADTGVFWDAEGLDIDHPNQLALLPKVETYTTTGTQAYPLWGGNFMYFVATTLGIRQFDDTADTLSLIGTNLAAVPVNRSVLYGPATGTNSGVFIPQGANGYQTFNTANSPSLANGTAGITPVAFALWDDKVAALETDGQLSFYSQATGAWTSPSTAKLNSFLTVKDLIVYYDRADEPSLYAVTTDGLYGYDPVAQTFKSTNVQLPKSPDNGEGAAVWRTGETLYLSAGLGVYAWTGPGGTLSPVGLDRKQGVPQTYQGKIVDLVPTLNHLYALVDATGITGAVHSVWRYNGYGWCRMWSHTNNTDAVTPWMTASGFQSTQRVWWCVKNTVYSMVLPRGFANPREIVGNAAGNYRATGYLISPWFDAGFENFDKLWVYHATRGYYLDYLGGNGNTINIKVEYQTDKSQTSWTTENTVYTNSLFRDRLNFTGERIRFRWTLSSNASTLSPIFDSAILKYVKQPTNYGSWDITFPLDFEGKWADGRDAQQIAHDLESLLTKTSIIVMEHNQNLHYVRVSSIQGWDETAESRKKGRTVTFVEVPYPQDTQAV